MNIRSRHFALWLGSDNMNRPTSRHAASVGGRFNRGPQRLGPVLAAFAVVSLLAGCEPRPVVTRAVAEITTREGATFIVVEPQAYYLRLCDAGEYPLSGDPDGTGLRAVVARKPGSTSGDEIPWSAIDSIVFSEPEGDLSGELGGQFCDGPASISATVRLKDGSKSRKQLIDTTDRGIEGQTARGGIVIPIRAIASLKMIEDRNWAWAAGIGNDAGKAIDMELRITKRTGEVRNVINPETFLGYEKRNGDRSLSTPVEDRYGFPAVMVGARILIPWDMLRRVEIRIVNGGQTLAAGDAPLAAHMVFSDGHGEDVGVRDCDIDGVPIDDIARIDIAAKSPARPK